MYNKNVYTGQKTYMSTPLIASHLLEIRPDAIIFEFEYRKRGRESRVYEFSYHTTRTLLDFLVEVQEDVREDGFYEAPESRVVDVVSQGMLYKYPETELAKILFLKMH